MNPVTGTLTMRKGLDMMHQTKANGNSYSTLRRCNVFEHADSLFLWSVLKQQ